MATSARRRGSVKSDTVSWHSANHPAAKAFDGPKHIFGHTTPEYDAPIMQLLSPYVDTFPSGVRRDECRKPRLWPNSCI